MMNFSFQKNIRAKERGFTLIEMLVAVALFSLIAFFSLGALLSIYDANRKSQTSKTVTDNLNLSIEDMTRTIRFGTNYYCGESSSLTATADCTGGNALSVTFNGKRVIFKAINGTIKRSDNGGIDFYSVTSHDTVIERLDFYVYGSAPYGSGDISQPYVVAYLQGYVGTKASSKTSFSIETVMSQRMLDVTHW